MRWTKDMTLVACQTWRASGTMEETLDTILLPEGDEMVPCTSVSYLRKHLVSLPRFHAVGLYIVVDSPNTYLLS